MPSRPQRLQQFLNTPLGQRYQREKEKMPEQRELDMQDPFYYAKFTLVGKGQLLLKNLYDYGMGNSTQKFRGMAEPDKAYQVSFLIRHIEEINRALERME